MLRLQIQSGDKKLQEHPGVPRARLCTVHQQTVQNELLQDILKLINTISKKVASSTVWAILADETTDLSFYRALPVELSGTHGTWTWYMVMQMAHGPLGWKARGEGGSYRAR